MKGGAMRGLAVMAALVVVARSAWADEQALMSITFGVQQIEIRAGEVRSVELQADAVEPSLIVTLDAVVAPRLSALTGGHVGQRGAIRVCGRVVSEPVLQGAITDPSFVISDPDPAEIRRLARVLAAQDCAVGA
jgi:preprotein translocase subunit SecD